MNVRIASYLGQKRQEKGLSRFGDKIVPFDNTMEKDSSLYQLFNTNFHEMVNKKITGKQGKNKEK